MNQYNNLVSNVGKLSSKGGLDERSPKRDNCYWEDNLSGDFSLAVEVTEMEL